MLLRPLYAFRWQSTGCMCRRSLVFVRSRLDMRTAAGPPSLMPAGRIDALPFTGASASLERREGAYRLLYGTRSAALLVTELHASIEYHET